MLSAILAKLAQDAIAAVARDPRSEAVGCPTSFFLLVPADWGRLHKSSESNGRPLPSVENRIDEVRPKLREVQDAGHVGGRNPLAFGEFADSDPSVSLRAARTAGSPPRLVTSYLALTADPN